jgi:hypothetical protein
VDPLYVFEGYTINERWVIILAVAHNCEKLSQVRRTKPMAWVSATSVISMRGIRELPTRLRIGYSGRDMSQMLIPDPLPALCS